MKLLPWRPRGADGESMEPAEHAVVPDNAFLVDIDAATCDLHAFLRAADRAGLGTRLFEANPLHGGEDWYDRLPVVTGIALQWREGRDRWRERRCDEPPKTPIRGCRPEVLRIEMQIRGERGTAAKLLYLPADVAIANPDEEWPENGILLATGAKLTPDDLADFLTNACHMPAEPSAETDSRRRQRDEFLDRHFACACRLLLPTDEAARRTIEYLARRHLAAEVESTAPGRTITITLRPRTAPTAVLASRSAMANPGAAERGDAPTRQARPPGGNRLCMERRGSLQSGRSAGSPALP